MPLRRLIDAVHRRFVWQVAAAYAAAGWLVLEGVLALTRLAGLPDWVPGFAFALLLLGFPIVLATAVVQQRLPGAGPAPARGSRPDGSYAVITPSHLNQPRLRRALTWRRTALGGVAGAALLLGAVGAYFVMRSLGVGPVASLQAQGLIDRQARVVLADFRNATSDSLLGAVVTEAMRIDLSGSRLLTLVGEPQVEEALRGMRRDRAPALDRELAQEVAIRGGYDLVLEGEVGRAGAAYAVSAALRSAQRGITLATFRRAARTPDDVIAAIDKLAQDVREKAGESLRTIRGEGALQSVTTASLPALRKYVEGRRLLDAGREEEGLDRLEEAVALDSAFAAAWHAIGLAAPRSGPGRERELRALEAAYRHRERLPARTRHLVEADYHLRVDGDRDALVQAYEDVLRLDPDDPTALNRLAGELRARGDLEGAERLLRRAVDGPGSSPIAYESLIQLLIQAGRTGAQDSALAELGAAYPASSSILRERFWTSLFRGNAEAAEQALRDASQRPAELGDSAAEVWKDGALAALGRGRFAAFDSLMDAAAAAGRAAGAAAETRAHAERIVWLSLAGDSVAARTRLDALAASGLVEAATAAALPWPLLAEAQLRVGDRAAAARSLARWEREIPDAHLAPEDRAARRFFRVWAEGGGTSGLLDALAAYRRDSSCGRCLESAEAGWLAASGHPDDARETLRRFIDRPAELERPAAGRAAALELLAGLAEQAGDRAEAAAAYRRFVETWKDGDARAQARVRRARERLAALGG